jgi:hypothetical protein
MARSESGYASLVDSRDARLAENETLFRAANERMAAWEERQEAPPTEKHLFFCECASRRCQERVSLTIREYVAVRESPVRFVVLREHVFPGLERIIEEHEGYVVVEKHERFRHVVEQANDRWAVNRDGGCPRGT